ncbi:hypothetical protein ACQRIT_007591 [Beauveria bassiana]
MSRSLSAGQADELHKSILGYVIAQGQTTTARTLRAELHLADDVFTPATALKYGKLLEKKWNTVSRLERKVLELEKQSAVMESQLQRAEPVAKRPDPGSWIPSPEPKLQLESHTASVNCVAFHPVFSTLASGSDDCTIKIWDWELGELERTIKAHTQPVRDLDFGGPKGAVLLASCSSDLAVKLWDPIDGYSNIRTLNGHEHAVTSVRFLPCRESSKNLLVSASADQTIRVWNVNTGYCVKTLLGHGDWVRFACPSEDGRFLLSSSSDRTARLWDIDARESAAVLTLIGHENAVNTCAFAPPSSHQHLSSLAGAATAVPLSSSAEFLATGSRDKTIKLWDGKGRCVATLTGHGGWVNALVFHPGGKYIFSAADDKTLRFWDIAQNGQCVGILRGAHDGFITSLRWLPTVRNLPTQKRGGRDSLAGSKDSHGVAHFRCVIATGSMDRKVKVFASE